MNKKIRYTILAICWLLLTGMVSSGQDPAVYSLSNTDSGQIPRENVYIFTDRMMYAVTEKILYKVTYRCEGCQPEKPWSTVVYLELTGQTGHPYIQQKTLLSGNGATGSLTIPEELRTGTYYLKAYTRWMRNFPAECYECQPIEIINPYSGKSVSSNDPGNARSTGEPVPFPRDSFLLCSTGKSVYHTRDSVTLTVSSFKETLLDVAITVTRKGNCALGYAGTEAEQAGIDNRITGPYFPEPRGISVSGTVINKETGQTVQDATVMMALLNQNACFSGFITGNDGRFIFTFPDYQGSFDLYAEAIKEDQNLSILIDDEFCKKSFSPRVVPFTLTENEKETAEEISLNMQIARLPDFSIPYSGSSEKVNPGGLTGFYGDPVRTINTARYINLPDLREFLFELVPEFRIENQKKTTVLKLNRITSLAAYSPLCLVDNVPVTHLDDFLKIPTEKIERIEIIDKPWITGNTQYNGIIQAFSKKRDMAGINIPPNSKFFRYRFLSDTIPPGMEETGNREELNRIPDRRNTLYWNPDVKINPGEKQSFTFYTADLKGEYEVVIMGLSPDKKGKTIFGRTTFAVQ